MDDDMIMKFYREQGLATDNPDKTDKNENCEGSETKRGSHRMDKNSEALRVLETEIRCENSLYIFSKVCQFYLIILAKSFQTKVVPYFKA